MPPGSKRKREVEEDDTGPTQRPQGDRTTEIARQCELPEDNLTEDTPSGHAPADGGDSTTEPSSGTIAVPRASVTLCTLFRFAN